jgi:hypothetical protein
MSEQIFSPGSVIFGPGDLGDRAFLIHEGSVELIHGKGEAAERVSQLGPDEVFGEMSLIEERPRALTARAISAVKVAALTRSEFERLLVEGPSKCRPYLNALFERLRSLSAPHDVTMDSPTVEAEAIEAEKAVYVTIHPLTHRAAETLPDEGLLIPKFPFRIGRASDSGEREPHDLNDWWLLDREPYNISRNHCLIDLRGNDVFIKDRGTSLGMWVNELRVGGHLDRRQADLHEGDNVVVLGGPLSPYQFRIHVARG